MAQVNYGGKDTKTQPVLNNDIRHVVNSILQPKFVK